jgi:phage tail-like protein
MKRKEIERLLPAVFQRTLREGNPLVALLEVMEALHEPSEAELERLDATLDPRRTSEEFVPFLARWVDLEWLLDKPPGRRAASSSLRNPITTGPGRLRELVAAAAHLSQWRGTAKGLLLFLETATGVQGFEVEEEVSKPDGGTIPYHIHVRAPQSTASHKTLIERIIEMEKPAYVTYELSFG